MKTGLNAYHKNKVRSASQVEQVAIVLDQAARLMNKAIKAIEANDIELRSMSIDKAMKLMSGLRGALDQNNKEDETQVVVEVMSSFYQQMTVFMMKASLNADVKLCHAIEVNLHEMAKMWRNASAQPLPVAMSSVSTGSLSA